MALSPRNRKRPQRRKGNLDESLFFASSRDFASLRCHLEVSDTFFDELGGLRRAWVSHGGAHPPEVGCMSTNYRQRDDFRNIVGVQ